MSCDSGGEEAWVGVGWDPPRPDRVPDILANFLEALRGEPQPVEGPAASRLWPSPGCLPSERLLLLPNVTPPKTGFSKIP